MFLGPLGLVRLVIIFNQITLVSTYCRKVHIFWFVASYELGKCFIPVLELISPARKHVFKIQINL